MITLSAYVAVNKYLIFQASIGMTANTFLLLFHILTLLLDHRPKPTDLITSHLAFVHITLLITVLFLFSPDLFGSLNFWNDFKCKSLFYTSRVLRGLSISTTCLLSIIQAITISPSTSWLAQFKYISTHFIFYFFPFVWLICLSLSIGVIFHTMASSNVTQTNMMVLTKYCSLSPIGHGIMGMMFTMTTYRDVFLVGVMLLSSVYMVILLSRHQKRSQYLHSTSPFPRSSPENKATRTILLLVSFFVVMYWADLIISSSSVILWTYDSIMLGVQSVVANVYASASPLVLIISDKRVVDMLHSILWK